jgi:hypothetical protein
MPLSDRDLWLRPDIGTLLYLDKTWRIRRKGTLIFIEHKEKGHNLFHPAHWLVFGRLKMSRRDCFQCHVDVPDNVMDAFNIIIMGEEEV